MAISAAVNNGILDYNYTDNSAEAKAKQSVGSDLGYDQFLQLLCAEMQYQDPLEPTTNTDYVAQLATFSQLEATLSMQTTTEANMAKDLVGKQVVLSVPNENTGTTQTVTGMVDYVTYQEDKAYLNVNGNSYSVDYLESVADQGYYDAGTLAQSIHNMVGQLPDKASITVGYKGAVQDVRDLYEGLTDYQKGFVSDDDLKTLREVEARIAELEKAAEERNSAGDAGESETSDIA